nr:MAG TPA: hypothetical protein [Caudoviricetes sp.]
MTIGKESIEKCSPFLLFTHLSVIRYFKVKI